MQFSFQNLVIWNWSLCMCSVLCGELPFDSFVYTQQQPETLCVKTRTAHEHCSIPRNVTTWTVHGLWPTKTGTKGPFNCNTSAAFDPDKLKPILGQLWKYWPDLFSDHADYDFWKHEWYKHGTCALNLSATHNEFLYFNTALKLQARVDLGRILSDAGISASDDLTYPLEMIRTTLENAIGKKVLIECYINHKKQYLWQVEVCMDTKFRYIDCTAEGTCTSKYGVIYPIIKHPYLSLQQL